MAKCVAVRSRFVTFALVSLLAHVACSGDDDDADTTSRDAGADRDAGRDGGGVPFACGSETCVHPAAYCRVTPTQPCTPRDGGTCGATEVECREEGVTGCTTGLGYDCPELPAGCTSCPCVILEAPCGAQVTNVECNRAPTGPVTARCPFP